MTNSIPPFSKDDKIYSDDNDKASIFNDVFRDQTLLDDSQAALPQTKPLPAHKLDSVITTPQEVESTLKSLPLRTASASTNNLCFEQKCFEQKCEKYQRFLSENLQFLEMKVSIYLNKHVFVMYILCQTFDKASHRRLLYYGICNDILLLISVWLSGRTQRGLLDAISSDPIPILSGVSKGSVLGCLLFLITDTLHSLPFCRLLCPFSKH